MNSIPGGLREHLGTFDVVHVHQGLTPFGAYCSAIVASQGIPLVITDLGGGRSQLMLEGKGVELADRVISLSKYANALIKGSYTGKTEVVSGPVDTEFFTLGNTPNIELSPAICVSRIMPHKGIDRIISALPEGLALKVVGTVYHEEYYRLLISLAKGKDVSFVHGASDNDLLSLYRESGLFLQASTHRDVYGNLVRKPELLGLTSLEAMSCGLPVLVSNAGSLPELIPRNCKFAKIFHTDLELSSMLNDYLRKEWPIGKISDVAHEYVDENFGLSSVGQQLFRVYSEILTK
jgi:glycosyltransferase involved in cell wall biosynthesis